MRRERGVALIIALWVIALLTVIAGNFTYAARTETLLARNLIAQARARALADGAVDRAVFELARAAAAPDPWKPDGSVHAWVEGEAVVAVSVVDESARIDLNAAPETLVRGLFVSVGVPPEEADRLVDQIVDWKDADDLRRPNGAEQDDYAAAGRKYAPANAPFEDVEELQRVLAVSPDLFAKVAGSLTVYSRQPGVNAATAPRSVLLALPGADAASVDLFIEQRRQAIAQGLPVPAFIAAGAFPAGAGAPVRVTARAIVGGETSFVREAVVLIGVDPRAAYRTLAWSEGRGDAFVAAAVGATSADAGGAPR